MPLKFVALGAGFLGILFHSLIAKAQCPTGFQNSIENASRVDHSLRFREATYQCPADQFGYLVYGYCGPIKSTTNNGSFFSIADNSGKEWFFEYGGKTTNEKRFSCTPQEASVGKQCYQIETNKKILTNEFSDLIMTHTSTSYYPYKCSKPNF